LKGRCASAGWPRKEVERAECALHLYLDLKKKSK